MPVQTQLQQRRGTAASWTSTNPTLAAGEIGFETDTGKFKIGNGSTAWAALAYSAGATAVTYLFNATSGQTTFSGADANGLTLAYTVGAEQVYLNGVLQVRGSDYTATNGTSIVLTSGALTSDVLNVIAYSAMTITDTYTQAQADAKFYQTAVTSMAGKNAIINGAMEIDQRNTATTAATTTAGVSSTVFGPDRARLFSNNAGVFSIQQVQDAPAGFRYSCKITTTTADASVTGADRANFAQFVENANWNRFAWGTASAKPVTTSFWVKSSVTGTYFYCINVAGGGAAYYTTYTINAANTWEYKTITIPGPTAASNWATNNVDVVFGGLCAGPDRQTSTLNSWTTDVTPALGTSSTVNLVSTLNATWQITGWQIEQGSVATTFSRAGGTIAGELAACQRYYQRFNSESAYGYLGFMAGAYTTVNTYAWRAALVKMRVAPTSIDTGGNLRLVTAADVGTAVTGITIGGQSVSTTPTLNIQVGSGLTSGTFYNLQGNNDTSAYVGFSAEL